jgi:outer membrane protein assembly factor BamB
MRSRSTRRPARRALAAALVLGCALAACSGGSGGGAANPTATGVASPSGVNPGGPERGDSTSASPSTSMPATTAPPTSPATDWPTYHHDLTRAGSVPGGPTGRGLATAWERRLDGAVYASPLVVGDTVIVATEHDTVYGLRRADGAVRWRTRLGDPVPLSDLPCGNIDPLGITGTPAYDATTGTVLVAAELRGPLRHELIALDATSGHVRWRRSIDLPGMTRAAEQQRGALAVASGRVYVTLGGLFGDCGDYHGYVIGSRLDGTGRLDVYRTPSSSRAGIWSPPGPAVDAAGHLYVSVGNGARTAPPYDDSDAVVELSPDLRKLGLFAPANWAAENAADLDLSSTSPVLLGNGRVLVSGKDGVTYLLRAGRLGGIGGALATLAGCHAYGGIAARAGIVALPCIEGVQAVDTRGDRLRVRWRAPSSITGTPLFARAGVWALDTDSGRLHLLAAGTGRSLAAVDVGRVTRFAAPAVSGGMILVPTVDGVVAVASR